MTETPEDLETWVRTASEALGIDPAEVPIGLLLTVTRDAAHGVTRPAGPVTTFLLGLAVARGADVDDAVATVRAQVAQWRS